MVMESAFSVREENAYMRVRLSLGRFGCSVALSSLLLGACSTGSGPATTGTSATGTGGSTSAAGAGGMGMGGSAGALGVGGTAGSTTAGAAGSGGAAGATGMGGAAGSVGGQSVGGTGGASGAHVMPSTGCSKPAGQALMTYVKYTETIAGVPAAWMPRNYFVWLPANYDPNHAYPTVFVGPGCGGTGDTGIPIMKASGNDAIVIGLDPDPQAENRPCFNTESYPDPEVPYFDATLQKVEDSFCIDKSRLFIEGFSSGSWMTNLIGCVDGGVIRGQGNASGCMQGLPGGTCKGPVAYFGAHNNPDGNNSYDCGTSNRDRIAKLNGCSMTTMPYDPGPDVKAPQGATINCVQYTGCMPGYPVVFCTTTGLGHNDQVGSGLSTFGFWKFWMSLP
jgi:poly(3-hydroxybutyrate) depolymerase